MGNGTMEKKKKKMALSSVALLRALLVLYSTAALVGVASIGRMLMTTSGRPPHASFVAVDDVFDENDDASNGRGGAPSSSSLSLSSSSSSYDDTGHAAAWALTRKMMFEEYDYCRFNRFHEPELNLGRQYVKAGAVTNEGTWRVRMREEEKIRGKERAEKIIAGEVLRRQRQRRRREEEVEEEEGGMKRSSDTEMGKEESEADGLDDDDADDKGDDDDDANEGGGRGASASVPAPLARLLASNRRRGGMSYLHVGKAGGSTMSCHIRAAFPDVHNHCKLGIDEFPADGPLESELSRKIDCYQHYNDRPECYYLNDVFVINVRNPVHRIGSWFLYEHVWNMPFVHGSRAVYGPRCGSLMVSTCYSSFDEMATIGLGVDRPSADAPLRVGTDLSPHECAHWAWAAVQGQVPANFHNVYNYDWYASEVLDRPQDEAVLLVVRVEHLDSDWQVVDSMVGGSGDPLPGLEGEGKSNGNEGNNGSSEKNNVQDQGNRAKGSVGRVNVASSKTWLPVKNNYVSEVGIRNLCRALCEEIQIYKRILARAINLYESDVETSMEELRRTCPEEDSIHVRQCE